jgi:hypothetical protein
MALVTPMIAPLRIEKPGDAELAASPTSLMALLPRLTPETKEPNPSCTHFKPACSILTFSFSSLRRCILFVHFNYFVLLVPRDKLGMKFFGVFI